MPRGTEGITTQRRLNCLDRLLNGVGDNNALSRRQTTGLYDNRCALLFHIVYGLRHLISLEGLERS